MIRKPRIWGFGPRIVNIAGGVTFTRARIMMRINI
jgi:hypothetical protein